MSNAESALRYFVRRTKFFFLSLVVLVPIILATRGPADSEERPTDSEQNPALSTRDVAKLGMACEEGDYRMCTFVAQLYRNGEFELHTGDVYTIAVDLEKAFQYADLGCGFIENNNRWYNCLLAEDLASTLDVRDDDGLPKARFYKLQSCLAANQKALERLPNICKRVPYEPENTPMALDDETARALFAKTCGEFGEEWACQDEARYNAERAVGDNTAAKETMGDKAGEN